MRTLLQLILFFEVWSASGQNQNVAFNAMLTFPGQRLANIWGYSSGGQEYALVGGQNGLIIVDVTNPGDPQQIVQIPGVVNQWREIKTYSHYAYVVSEGVGSKIQIVDLSGLPSPNLSYHAVDGGSALVRAHALHIDEIKGYLYVYGSNLNGGRAQVFNLNGDPYNPTYVGVVDFIGYVHDGYVSNDMLYSAHIYAGQVAVVNMANKTNPVLLGTVNTPGNFPHNTWLSGNTMFTTDEVNYSYLTAYDITDPSDITELDRIQITPGSGSVVHNTHILNDYAVTSWYKDGFAIIDVSRPSNMVEVGRYDTYPDGSGPGFEGCWGVYPYLPSGTIVASNIRASGTNDGELWVLTPTYVRGCYLEGTVTDAQTGNPVFGATVQILNTSTYGSTNPFGEYKIGQLQDGTFTVQVSASNYLPQQHTVTLSNGVLTTLNAALLTKSALPVEWKGFEVRPDGQGALLLWETAQEINNAGFEIQYNPETDLNWSVAGFVPSKESASFGAAYSYTVPELGPGNHLFRLRQIDLDGKSSFSPVRALTIRAKGLDIRIWPNPAKDHSWLRLRSEQPAQIEIDVLDARLKPVGERLRFDVDSETIIPLNIGELPAGVYYIRLWQDREYTVHRFVRMN